MKRLRLPTICALARCCLGMQDDSFWRNTAGMNRINGWRLPAKEGLARLLTPAGRAGVGRR